MVPAIALACLLAARGGEEAKPVPLRKVEDPITELVRRMGDQDLGAQVDAFRKIEEKGPDVIPVLEELLGEKAYADLRPRIEALVDRLHLAKIVRILAERSESGLVFSGQYADLKAFGDRSRRALLRILADERATRGEGAASPILREAAANALADLGDPSLLAPLQVIWRDPLSPDWLEEAAGFASAALGDRGWVEGKIRHHEKRIEKGDPRETLEAREALARIHYRSRDYGKALEQYDETIALLRSRLEGNPVLAHQVRRFVQIQYYNAACSACLAKELARAYGLLRTAMDTNPEDRSEMIEMIQSDGDLEGLRKDEGFEEFIREISGPTAGKR